jgi:hypothetical protein
MAQPVLASTQKCQAQTQTDPCVLDRMSKSTSNTILFCDLQRDHGSCSFSRTIKTGSYADGLMRSSFVHSQPFPAVRMLHSGQRCVIEEA